ncbi:MAG: hypothetical protein NWE83_05985 [Candidatus Bathyarchaeota archaeon]|nr:hypothetical protein [Candidatus Bathyarchaeota archaeon]
MPRRERPKGRRGERPERRRIWEMGLKGVFKALALKKNRHLRDETAWALSFYGNTRSPMRCTY